MQTDQTYPRTGSGGGGPSRGVLRHTRPLKAHSSRSEVSDSEEERQKYVWWRVCDLSTNGMYRRMKLKRAALSTVNQNELPVVVISSDEEDEPRCVVSCFEYTLC